ncbi:MAG: tetraacyldisaccharide 4'-kinase [Myxococcales bacterium]|nr:tetraacyldisaccharide 4'-kinase [Myxococcales bacterium]
MTWESLWYGPRGWRTAVLAPALAPLSWLYSAGVAARNAAFSLGLRRPVRVGGATVISVGNLLVGGAGKTPVAIFLARWASACGRKVAVLSRGYGRASTQEVHFTSAQLPAVEAVGDEPRLIARRCPGVEVWVGAKRASLALAARERGADFLLLDDGFQHRQLHRDVDLVVLSEAGNGHRLPWGPLRESPAALSRATLTWAAAGASGEAIAHVRSRLAATALIEANGEQRPVESLRGRAVVLLAGIARPERVVRTLEALGARIAHVHAYVDHHAFSRMELEKAQATARKHGALLVTTEKDRERLPDGLDALALRVELEVTHGLDALAHALGLDKALVHSSRG